MVSSRNDTCATDFIMNRLAILVVPSFTLTHIVYLDPKGQFIDRVNISTKFSRKISLRDGTIKCTDESSVPVNRTMSFLYFPLLENPSNSFRSCLPNASLPFGNMSQPCNSEGGRGGIVIIVYNIQSITVLTITLYCRSIILQPCNSEGGRGGIEVQ
jgi:hypothetical protein